MKCVSCGHEQPTDGGFCQFCGAAFANRTIHQSTGGSGPTLPCACGRSLRSSDLFCPSCGRGATQPRSAASSNYQYPPPPQDAFRTYGPGQATPNPYGQAPTNPNPYNSGPAPTGYPLYPQGPGPYPPVPYGGYPHAYPPAHIGPQGLYPYRQKDKVVAGLLALFLGGLGIHKFYLGQAGWGILYLLFFWTCIPMLVAGIEGIIYLVQSDQSFDYQYNLRQ